MKYTASFITIAVMLTACGAPPSVQKVIDEKQAEQAAINAPVLNDPIVSIAQRTGRDYYNRELIGQWAPQGACTDDAFVWRFTQEDFARPQQQPCPLAVVEELNDGSYAMAGYCPRITTMDEAEVVVFARVDPENIIVQGTKGGPLVKC